MWHSARLSRVPDLQLYPGVRQTPWAIEAEPSAAAELVSVLGHVHQGPPKAPPIDLAATASEAWKTRLTKIARPYQKQAIAFGAERGGSILAVAQRLGKCLITIGIAETLRLRRNLILSPAIGRWGWATEVWRWLGEEAVTVRGRGAREIYQFCGACTGSGAVNSVACDRCGGKGFMRFFVRIVQPGARCPRDGWANTSSTASYACLDCQNEAHEIVDRARWIIGGYDSIVPHRTRTVDSQAPDGLEVRADLQGIGAFLDKHAFDLAALDEAQEVRGGLQHVSSTRDYADRRPARLSALLDGIPRVTLLTGTPFWGRASDIGMLVHYALGGTWSARIKKTPPQRPFLDRYCDPKVQVIQLNPDDPNDVIRRVSYDGISNETELRRRLSSFMLTIRKEDVFDQLPPVTRRTVWLEDIESPRAPAYLADENPEMGYQAVISQLAVAKWQAIEAEALSEVFEGTGRKIVVFVSYRKAAEKIFQQIERTVKSPSYRAAAERTRLRTWMLHGESTRQVTEDGFDEVETDDRTRVLLCQAFREHTGAAVIVVTIRAMGTGISLAGAAHEWFLNLDPSPGQNAQAEERAWLPDCPGFGISYVFARDTIDQALVERLAFKADVVGRLGDQRNEAVMAELFRNSLPGSLDPTQATTQDVTPAEVIAHWTMSGGVFFDD